MQGVAATEGFEAGKLSDVIYAKIVSGISRGDYGVGAKLPTENELAERYEVSRPIVREALARLRDNGLVVSRRGSGTYVRRGVAAQDRGIGPLASIADMKRCFEFRVSLEGESAWHAAANRAARDVLDDAMARLEAGMARFELANDDDLNFHIAIATATGNRFFVEVLKGMAATIETGMSIIRGFQRADATERLRLVHEEHRAVYDAIRRGRPDDARAAMRLHLENSMARAFEGML